ncbi:MAG: restriction endonuclease subunit S, partial [Sulfurovum sp.]|nr:restriction endonuclease subunit S [Sulfurovaceae bacterium]
MSKLEKYLEYKESGVEWLGEIPEGWEVRRLASLGRFSKGGGISRDKLTENGLPAILYGDIYTKYDISTITTKNFISKETALNAIKIVQNDILLTGSGETKEDIGKCIVFKGNEAYAGGDIIIFKQYSFDSIFLSYSLSSSYSIMQKMIMAKGEIIVHIYGSALKELKIVLPPKQEQIKIASFLDTKTEQLDKAIKQKEQLIEFLKERQQILINDAVTKGIDKTVTMKDSGVEWIGNIPKHWEVKKVKNIFNLIIDSAPNNNDEELLSIYTDIGVKPRKELADRGNKASTTDGYWKVRKGDFIVNKLLAWMGAIGISNYDGVTSPAYDILRAKIDTVGIYYHELFRLKVFSEEMKKHSRGIMDMRLRLYFDKFGDIRVPYPSQDEQQLIVNYIEKNNQKINKAIDLQQQ